ncbi:unnamed protein product (macronuclear) [Paramecium tetraurelia]|uniref:Transmembrane protein n=1 Tax=Paramecium tetraurelia TaxID=5888 RepID=A0D3W2_PARTE|nr:uncharacterized protein GSPATT00013194001 [Paramecium tetraurelia]CAK77729.1 unnamed protein product [Paramecium tetraurelia]|eukprot:XP_001445126.1 hypothetical protein (macronuclear) [Paramecium tetraurelia strain d4-2]
MNKDINPIQITKHQYSPSVQKQGLQSLKWVVPICIICSLCSIVIAYMWYSSNGLTEYLLLGLNNVAILIVCIFSFYWSLTFQIVRDVINQQEGFPLSSIPYFHSLFTQILCAIQAGLVLGLIEYNSYNQFILILPLTIIEIFLLLYLANVSRQFNIREYGVQRLIIYATSAINLIFLAFAAYYLKKVISQINYQMYQVSSTNIEISFIKIILLVFFILTILVATFNVKKIKVFFVTISYIIVGLCIMAACVNGLLVRRIQSLNLELSSPNGCRFAMQTISETSLKDELQCSQKYLNLDLSPYLPCDQDQQTYEWESNSNIKLGCVNLQCCKAVQNYLFSPINSLTIWINLIIMIGLVQSFNAAILSESTFKKYKMHIVGDGVVFIILLILAILTVCTYNFTPDLQIGIQHALVKEQSVLNQITILPTPVYKNFDKQEKLIGFHNLQSCQQITAVMLQKITFSSDNNQKGIILAIQGTNGQFTILNEVNQQDLSIIVDNDITKEFFQPQTLPFDRILIKGKIEEAENFINNNLYFCSDNPLSADFEILKEFYEIQKKRILEGVSKDAQKYADQAFKFYNIKIVIEDATNFQPIQNSQIEIYDGKFLSQSCQIIKQLESNLYELTTDENGSVTLNNLSQGNSYTIMIYKPNYKRTCSVLDLQRRIPKTNYIFRLTSSIQKHSVRVILEWSSKSLNLDLYGIFKVNEHSCLTGPLSKSCGGMEHISISKEDQHIEILDITQLEPYRYTLFVKRFLTRQESLDLLSKSGINQDWIDSDPHITVYLNELKYPLVEFRLPQITNQQMDRVDMTWMVFQIDGIQSDAPNSIQKMTSEISNDEIKTNTSFKKSYWPNI